MGWGQKHQAEDPDDVPFSEASVTSETTNTWNTTNETVHYEFSSLIEHDEEVRIRAIELTMEYFKGCTLRPDQFLRFAQKMEKFIMNGEVPDAVLPQDNAH